jgi:hypothetical protein
VTHPNFVGHSEDGRYLFFNGHKKKSRPPLFSTNSLKIQWKYRMMKREYTITNPRKRRMKDENQTGGKTLAGLPQVQFTKKIRLRLTRRFLANSAMNSVEKSIDGVTSDQIL